MMRSYLLLLLAASSATSACAFVSSHRLPEASRVHPIHSAISLSKDDNAVPDAIRNFAAVCAITCGLLYPTDSFAINEHSFQSSTMAVAEVIRTMDFSLPSGSYDNIVGATASGKDELTTEMARTTASDTKKAAAPTKKEPARKKEKKEASPQKSAMTKAEREEAAAKAREEKAKADAERQKEIDAKIKADREARIAARKAAEAEKEAAEAEKLQETYKGAKILDTSMPEY